MTPTATASTPTPRYGEQVASFTGQDSEEYDHFGSSVALEGETAIIGSPRDDDPNGWAGGSASAFERMEGRWSMDTKLVPADGRRESEFGISVALNDDIALVGAKGADASAERTGAPHLFEPEDSEWVEQTKLQQEDGEFGDRFGTSVALTERRGFVGASDGESQGTNDSGAVHVFSV